MLAFSEYNVSIPFKRESISKVKEEFILVGKRIKGFHSLQTGKHIQRGDGYESIDPAHMFPFPSNGKAYPKSKFRDWQFGNRVSIPFKRESISKVMISISIHEAEHIMFPFPSNGKAYPKEMEEFCCLSRIDTFPFPSNGKAYPKVSTILHYTHTRSFHSLQTGKHIQSSLSQDACSAAGVSIPFKRESISKEEYFWASSTSLVFPFPSNGKAYPKFKWQKANAYLVTYVSIPFKRESISKV